MPVLATALLPRLAVVGVLAVSSPPLLPACDTDSSDDGEVFTAADGTTFRVEVVVTGLQIPWSLAFTPDGRLLVTERPARVRVVENGQLLESPALTLTDAWANGEAGVLGLAVDPAFSQNRFVYLLYTQDRGTLPPVNRLVRYRELNNTLAEAVVIFDDIPGALTHDGGRVRFGPDGLLYVTMGDIREASDAQDLAAFTGKIFRLNPDGTTPPTNPLASPVYSYGHRNPQGLDWHPVSGALWATEHGDIGNDELNLIAAGANYGWPIIEGAGTMPGMMTPVLSFSPAIAPSGASFYVGQAIPGFRNDLFIATLRGEYLHRVHFDPSDPGRVLSNERLLEGRFGRLRDVVTGPDGALYVCTSNRDGRGSVADDDDRIIRLFPAG